MHCCDVGRRVDNGGEACISGNIVRVQHAILLGSAVDCALAVEGHAVEHRGVMEHSLVVPCWRASAVIPSRAVEPPLLPAHVDVGTGGYRRL